MGYIFGVALMCLSCVSCASDVNIRNKVILDVVNSYDTPSSILVYSSSNKQTEMGLLKEINRNKIFKPLQDVTKVRWQDMQVNAKNMFIVADLNCPGIDEFLSHSGNIGIMRSPYRWIFFDENQMDAAIPPALVNLFITPDSEASYIHKVSSNAFEIKLFYRISSQGAWKTETYGTWNTTHRLRKRVKEVTALRRLNVDGYNINIGYVVLSNNSIRHLTDRLEDKVDTLTKINFPITNHLLDYLNASRTFIFTGSWGILKNNTWNGLAGYLSRGEIDIGGSAMFMTKERFPFSHFIACPSAVRFKFVFKQPKLSYANNLFLLSFEKTLWYGLLALMALTFLVLFLTTIWEWKTIANAGKANGQGVLRPNLSDVGMLIVGATCQQGSTVELKGLSGRLVLLLLFVALTFFYTSFCANIVALLQSSSSQINTLSDLLYSKLRMGVEDNVYNRYYFSVENEPVRRAIYETKIAPPGAPPNFMSLEEGVKEMRKGLFAFHMPTAVGYKVVGKYFEESEKCGLQEIGYLSVLDPWMAVYKNSTFLEMYKIGIKRIKEHGLQERGNSLFHVERPKCSGTQASFVSVSMIDCLPAFLVLIYGALISVFVVSVESILHRFNVKRKNQYS